MAKYLDVGDTVPTVHFPGKPETPPTNKMTETREKFLFCRDVILARTGEQVYLPSEVPLEPGAGGVVVVERTDDEVFHPDAIESFNGKPFTNDHPYNDVMPDNYGDHLRGVVMNPRRGTGEQSNFLMGDIMVYDPQVMRDIRSGKRQVSCGYDADYVRNSPGRGKQVNIRGNHVSLVDAGRCGPSCAINDRKSAMSGKKKTFIDSITKAFKAKDDGDDAEMAKHLTTAASVLEEPKKDGEEVNQENDTGDGEGDSHHHVTVNIGGLEHNPPARAKDEDPTGSGGGGDGAGAVDPQEELKQVVMAAVAEVMAPIVQRLDALEESLDETTNADPDDSQTQDAVARAEVIKPGITLPTFDSKPGSKSHRDAVVNFKRKVLTEAMGSADTRQFVAPFVRDARPNFKDMSPETLDVIFVAASHAARDSRNSRVPVMSAIPPSRTGDKKIKDAKSWNDNNKKFWNRAAS